MSRADAQRVAVVGAGLCTPAGTTSSEFWQRVSNGVPSAQPTEVDGLDNWRRMACRVESISAEGLMAPHELRRLDRPHLLAISAADDALDAVAGRLPDLDRCALQVGTGYGAGRFSETQQRALMTSGLRAVSPIAIPLTMPNSIAAHLSIRYHFRGPALTQATACASGANAIGEAVMMLQADRADLIVAGGVDSLLFAAPLAGFDRAGALTRHDADPFASRPFDVKRDGFVMGEGAGFVVLVRTTDAIEAGLEVLGEVLGYAANSDAVHLVAPDRDGHAASRCMADALRHAGLHPSDIGHVNAHGTSTVLNDRAEAIAIGRVFGSSSPPVTATKGVTGHLIGGSGAVETIATLLACRERVVPPVAGLTELDGEIDLDVVHGDQRSVKLSTAVSNSFAFGGHNASLVVSA
ncbi:MAG TPA: beta-ketoacyl-[acyl-carrier-protein] synthase family protein [Ilumatobacteraceae bacterium]|nr:beta-ketoacyl-[acyl-carrier-protein] synthase family protein [Ilumatobacteraceae bacterium]